MVQGSEVDLMSDWLEENEYPVPVTAEGGDGSGPRAPEHGHDADMPGMLTDAEMAELEEASGAEFDRLFLEGMIKHHEGALTMCEEVAGRAARSGSSSWRTTSPPIRWRRSTAWTRCSPASDVLTNG